MQNDKLKKIIPILIIVALLGLGALAYFLFFKNTDTNKDPAIDLPVSGNIKPGSGSNSGSTKPGNVIRLIRGLIASFGYFVNKRRNLK
jgi:flagellar basal body-associated protein FliL